MPTEEYAHIDDQQLLHYFYQDKNNEWLGILLPRYTLLLLGVCVKYLKNEELAKDAVQQVFIKAITELHKYKVDYFKSWIYMVAKNHCLMQLRDKNKATLEMKEQYVQKPYEQTDVPSQIEKDHQLQNMEIALQQLSIEQKQCVTLFYLQKLSYQQIATQTSFTLLQVKSHIQNGKRNLKLILERMQ